MENKILQLAESKASKKENVAMVIIIMGCWALPDNSLSENQGT